MTKPKDPADYLPMGRPTEYKEEYCQALMDYFNVKSYEESDITYETKSFTKTETKRLPSKFPTIEGFAARVAGVSVQTLLAWTKDHPDFLQAYMRAKQCQKDVLIEGGMSGIYDSRFAQFVAVNCSDMRDKVQLTGSEDGPVIIQIVPPASSGAEIEVKVDK